MAARPRYVAVEGCLDAALVGYMLSIRRVEAEVGVHGAKRNVLRIVASLAKQGIPVVGVVDADDDAASTLEEAAGALGGGRVAVYRCGAYTLHYVERRPAIVTVWCDAWRGCRRGTVEDVVAAALREAYGCAVHASVHGCSECRADPVKRIYKLLVPAVAASCAGTGTLVSTRVQRYCGLDVEAVLGELKLGEKSSLIACYASLLAGAGL